MRIVLVSGMYADDGRVSAGFVHRQVRELQELRLQVHVVAPVARFQPSGSWSRRLRSLTRPGADVHLDGVAVHYMPYPNPPRRLSPALLVRALERALLGRLLRLRASFDFQLIHANHLFPIGYAALRAAAALNVPVVLAARGSDVHTNPHRDTAVGRYTRAAIRGARVYAVSEGLARQVAELAEPLHPVAVIHNGVDTNHFRPLEDRSGLRRRLGLPVRGTAVCTVARLVPEKGIGELLRAFASLAVAEPDAWLVVVGDGPALHRFESMARDAGITDRVRFAGRRPHDELPLWLNASDIFVLPSYNEGLPNVALEAMACRLPVVATAVGGVPEAVVDGVTGLLVPPRSIEPLANALRALIVDPARRALMGRRALQRIHRHFLWEHSTRALIALYESVLVPSRMTAAAPRRPAAAPAGATHHASVDAERNRSAVATTQPPGAPCS